MSARGEWNGVEECGVGEVDEKEARGECVRLDSYECLRGVSEEVGGRRGGGCRDRKSVV